MQPAIDFLFYLFDLKYSILLLTVEDPDLVQVLAEEVAAVKSTKPLWSSCSHVILLNNCKS